MKRQLLFALCLLSLILGWALDAVSNSGLEDLKDGRIWRLCEHYYLSVEKYGKGARHYIIRDISIEFITRVQELKPRTKKEAFLYVECVNLANGNATYALEEIQRAEAADDEFLEMARIDATNNSNFSQWKYMDEIADKYDLPGEAEVAREYSENKLRQARTNALGQVLDRLGLPGVDLGPYSGGYNGGAAFSQAASFAAWVYQALALPGGASVAGGSSPAIKTKASNVTLAPAKGPSGSPGAGASSGSRSAGNTSPGGTGPSEIAVAGRPTQPPPDAVLQRARHIPKTCASYEITATDVSMARVRNHCAMPIAFYWCWVPVGGGTCEPNRLSRVVAPDESIEIHGPSKGERQTAQYIVCDMSNPDHICSN